MHSIRHCISRTCMLLYCTLQLSRPCTCSLAPLPPRLVSGSWEAGWAGHSGFRLRLQRAVAYAWYNRFDDKSGQGNIVGVTSNQNISIEYSSVVNWWRLLGRLGLVVSVPLGLFLSRTFLVPAQCKAYRQHNPMLTTRQRSPSLHGAIRVLLWIPRKLEPPVHLCHLLLLDRTRLARLDLLADHAQQLTHQLVLLIRVGPASTAFLGLEPGGDEGGVGEVDAGEGDLGRGVDQLEVGQARGTDELGGGGGGGRDGIDGEVAGLGQSGRVSGEESIRRSQRRSNLPGGQGPRPPGQDVRGELCTQTSNFG